MKQTKEKAMKFIRKYKLVRGELSVDRVKDIIRRQGFLLVRYNKHGETADKVEMLLNELGLKDYSRGRDGFIYANGVYKYLFLHNQLSEEEELYILLHEEGHIFCRQPTERDVLTYSSTLNEKEAHEFALYIMRYMKNRAVKRAMLIAAAVLVVSLIVFALVSLPPTSSNNMQVPGAAAVLEQLSEDTTFIPQKIVWVAKGSEIYHNEWCDYIKGMVCLRGITAEKARSEGLWQCRTCTPDTRN